MVVALVAVAGIAVGLLGRPLLDGERAEEVSLDGKAPVAPTPQADTALTRSPQPSPSQLRRVEPTSPHSVLAPPADPVKEQQERAGLVVELERSHRAQPIDAAWAGKTEPALEELIVNDGIVTSGLDPKHYSADCRSETCEISVSFDSAADAEDWGMMYVTLTGRSFARTRSMVIPKGDGTAELRVYGYRRR